MANEDVELDYEGKSPDRARNRERTRERLAWGVLVAALAVLALRTTGGGAAPRDSDLAFVRTLMEVKGHLTSEYVRELDDETLRQAAINGMLRLATDPYTQYVRPVEAKDFDNSIEGRFDGIGVTVEAVNRGEEGFNINLPSGGLRIIRPLPDSPAAEAGLLAGDKIVGVDGEDITELDQQAVIERITGPTGTTVTLTIERPVRSEERSVTLQIDVQRAAVQSPVVEGFSRNPDGSPEFLITPPEPPQGFGSGELPRIGFIQLTQFTPGSAAAVQSILAELRSNGGLDGLILDLRNNPGGVLQEAVQLSDLFLDGGVIVWSEGENSPRRIVAASEGPDVDSEMGSLPVVVLVNRVSASASEVFAGALSDHARATVVGERSYGKGSVQDVVELGDTGRLKITTAYYHLPSGRIVHREPESETWGIDPHVEQPVDLDDPAALGGPFFPQQVWRAYEVILAELAARQATEFESVVGSQ